MYVEIFKLGKDEEIATFPVGSYVLGRGPTLQCNDKRVSRNHAALEVTQKNVKLRSTHINPCFMKAANSKTITILAKDSTAQLNDGDRFALLPEDFWFKIKIVVDEDISNGVEAKNETEYKESSKRVSCSSADEAPPDKRHKIDNENVDMPEAASFSSAEDQTNTRELCINETEDNQENEDIKTAHVLTEERESNEQDNKNGDLEATNEHVSEDVETSDLDLVKEENVNEENSVCDLSNTTQNGVSNESKQEEKDAASSDKNDVKDAASDKNDVKDAASSNKDDGDPGQSNPKPRREKCWYAAECYRKNPAHRQEYTHPGDSDFESDPDDNRPSCSYGATCYRKNKAHRRDYKHPPRDPAKKKKRLRKKVNRLNAASSQDVRDVFNEFSDSEDDPFIADDDSEEYVGESDDNDSDFTATPDTDED